MPADGDINEVNTVISTSWWSRRCAAVPLGRL
jgi:hypothetical protein